MLKNDFMFLVNRTTFVFSSYYNTEFPTIQPVAFQLIIQERSFKHDFEVHSIFYAGKAFGSLEQFLSEYAQDAIPKISRKFLENAPGEDSIPGSMNSRGNKFPETPHAGPRQFEPNGPRYSIVEQHVKYDTEPIYDLMTRDILFKKCYTNAYT